jgi:hypothetical protein
MKPESIPRCPRRAKSVVASLENRRETRLHVGAALREAIVRARDRRVFEDLGRQAIVIGVHAPRRVTCRAFREAGAPELVVARAAGGLRGCLRGAGFPLGARARRGVLNAGEKRGFELVPKARRIGRAVRTRISAAPCAGGLTLLCADRATRATVRTTACQERYDSAPKQATEASKHRHPPSEKS